MTSSSTTSEASVRASILRGYRAAVQAIVDAEVHGDPDWPALHKTLINPKLTSVQGFIKTQSGLHLRDVGTADVVRAEVTSYSPAKAAVTACVHGQVIAYQADGQPVPGNAGRPTYAIETAVMVPAGLEAWVVQDGSAPNQYATAAEAGGLCAG